MANYQKESIHFPSADGKHQIAGYFYTPEQPKAVIQLSHGMCEYVCRYEPVFEVLCGAGYAVCGNDHLGHGGSAEKADYGFFAEKNGYQYLLKDLKTMNSLAREKYPGLPVLCAGGVASNQLLRQTMVKSCGAVFAEPRFSTDNAMGVAILTWRRHNKEKQHD